MCRVSVSYTHLCKVPLHTIRNWRGSRCRIPELAKDKIEEVTGMKIFHVDVYKRQGVNATRLAVRALELRIIDLDNLEADEE